MLKPYDAPNAEKTEIADTILFLSVNETNPTWEEGDGFDFENGGMV